jgi:hypothetical protein
MRAIHVDNSSNALVFIQNWQENICRAIFSCPGNITMQGEQVEQKETRRPGRISFSRSHPKKESKHKGKKAAMKRNQIMRK